MDPSAQAVDPLIFPQYTSMSLQLNFANLIYGMAFYEAFLCLQLYAKVFTVNRLQSPIFALITLSVFTLVISTILHVLIFFSTNAVDFIFGPVEYLYNCIDVGFTMIGKVAYFAAGTLRSRSLLQKFPKLLYFMYLMLAISLIINWVMYAYLVTFWHYWAFTPPMLLDPKFPFIPAFDAYMVVTPLVQIFDTIYSNVLIASFLYPIFVNLEMKAGPALKAMTMLGDVQKSLWACVLTLAFLGFQFGFPHPILAVAVLHLWLHTQNLQFLRLSYVSTAELFSMHSKGVSTQRPGQRASIVASRFATSSHGNNANNV